jgi:hypothetical protein
MKTYSTLNFHSTTSVNLCGHWHKATINLLVTGNLLCQPIVHIHLSLFELLYQNAINRVAYKQQKFIFTVVEAGKFKIKALAHFVSGDDLHSYP